VNKLWVLLAVLTLSAMAFAGSVSVNFTDPGYTVVTTQYLATDGVTFSNALELTTGDGDIGPGMDYPLPPNGSNVITNDPADPTTMNIGNGVGVLAGLYVYSLTGYYTSPIGMTVTAYNSSGGVLATLVLAADNGASNLFTLSIPGCTGASFSAACEIAYVTFSDGGAPDTETIGQLTLDDAPTPEPGALLLMGTGILGLAGVMRRKLSMINVRKAMPALLGLMAFVCTFSLASLAATPRVITDSIDDNQRMALVGNTRPEANARNDRGRVSDSFFLEHILLQLKRSPAQEQALVEFMREQQDPESANYHNWLTPKQFGERFGLAMEDINAIAGWLQGHGFRVNVIYASHMVMDFSGTAGQVREAFDTEIHHINVDGEKHVANMSNPRIPVALSHAIAGIISLHDIPPHKMLQKRSQFTSGNNDFPYVLVPSDLATIYNLNPLFQAGITGAGQTIVVIEDTDVYNYPGDWTTFRNYFGLTKYTQATFTQIHPAPAAGGTACTDPGTNGDQDEAILDAQWSSAAAPNAAIVLASCKASGAFSFGGLLALQNLINESNTPPAVISMSYGESETQSGAALIALFNSAFQQAATEGSSVFVSAGDANAASSDRNDDDATHGIAVTGWGGSPYNVSVGGTDYEDGYLGNYGTYWYSYNNVFFGSAKSYIPEIPWNGTCASQLTAEFFGFATTYGSSGFCNDPVVGETLLSVFGGSGGPTGCATGAPAATSPSRVVSGTCAGFPKPSYQAGLFGNPNDGVRDLPDLSLFASNGIWGHYLVFCWSDVSEGGAACTGDPINWAGGGGTSFSSPIMAGMQALVNQNTGQRWGNPNNVYYQLANAEYGASGNSACNSSANGGPASSCVFYDVTVGDMNSPCTNNNCYLPSGTNGVMSAAPESLTSLTLSASGSGYSSTPTCAFSGGGGSGGTCQATGLGPVSSIALSAGGSGYTSTPTCALTGGGGTGATCTILADPIASGNVTNEGSGYTSRPTCTITGTGTGATCRATEAGGLITAITISTGGSGYTGTPTCAFTGGGGTGATCSVTPSTAATSIALTSAGVNYTSSPTCAISGGGGGSGATCTATASPTAVAGVSLTAAGSYQWLPLCTLSGGGGTGAACVPAANNTASSYNPAYGTNPGWDFATGIGTVNAYNLVTQWSSVPAGQAIHRESIKK